MLQSFDDSRLSLNNDSSNKSVYSTSVHQLRVIKILKSVNFQLLLSSYKSELGDFVFCSCDPEKKEPICMECAKICHSEHKNQIIEKITAICNCGMKSHKILTKKQSLILKQCVFSEWSITSKKYVYYL